MQVEESKIDAEGSLVVPAALRRAMGISGEENLTLVLDEDGLHIRTKRQVMARARAMVDEFVAPGQSLSSELIAERRAEVERQEGE